ELDTARASPVATTASGARNLHCFIDVPPPTFLLTATAAVSLVFHGCLTVVNGPRSSRRAITRSSDLALPFAHLRCKERPREGTAASGRTGCHHTDRSRLVPRDLKSGEGVCMSSLLFRPPSAVDTIADAETADLGL